MVSMHILLSTENMVWVFFSHYRFDKSYGWDMKSLTNENLRYPTPPDAKAANVET